ncbi:hypothetical protein [Salipiger mangrovisoli]|uniref:Methyl-accepting chemotaxis protein n=1 Tax=Salipiger mangrovisoli TaxID=2865933 RepID=A0ABR9WYG1_9RHOB|nr:hypothetical protein [Salipiger mangrovisoli]MBE9636317.1 hypothetical protein [Salipiger mangrovisoli]
MGDRTSQTLRAAAVRQDLEAMTQAVEGTFTRAADALLSGRENIGPLSDTLGRYCQGLLDFADTDVAQTITLLASRFSEAETAHAQEAQTIDRLIATLERTARPLAKLHETVRMIDLFSSTASVVESETDIDGELSFSSEIKSLSLRSREAYIGLIAQRDALLDQTMAIRTRQATFTHANLSHLAGLGSALQGLAAGLGPRLRDAARASSRVVEAVTGVSGNMSDGISALQVGDSFRQRLEHVGAALGPCLPDAATSPDAHALVLRIAAAQLAGAGRALDADLTRLAAVLRAASKLGSQFAEWGDALSGKSEVAPLLEDLRDRCGAGLAALYSSQAQQRSIERQMRGLRKSIAQMQGVISGLAQIDGDMRRGSLNVFLRSQRARRNGPAMMFVARQFGELTDTCSSAQASIVTELRTIQEITAGSVGARQDRVGEELQRIGDSLAGLGGVLFLWSDLRRELDGLLHRGPRAVDDFIRCAEEMKEQRAVARQIAALAARLHDNPPQSPATEPSADARAAAAALRALYSVPEEREIHDSICPEGHLAAPSGSASEDEEDFEWF